MALRYISLTRAQEHSQLGSLDDFTLIEVASEWLDANYVIDTFTTDGDGVSEDVPVIIQQATAELLAQFIDDEGLSGNQKRRKEKLGEYEVELEYEATTSGVSRYDDVFRLMGRYQTKPVQTAPIIG